MVEPKANIPRRTYRHRRGPSPSVRRALLRYFGGKRCVVRGEDENSNWHHLDDDVSNCCYANFVPVGSGINLALRDAHRVASTGKVPILRLGELGPDVLLAKATVWHARWETGLAYGCARLAHYVASAYLKEPPDSVLLCACDAFYYARHRFDERLLEDILTRDILPQVENARALTRITIGTVGLILIQLAGICSEFGLPRHAAEIFEAADRASTGSGSPSAVREAALLRRRAMVSGALGAPRREVNAQLRESIALASGSPNAELSVITTRVWLLQRDENWIAIASLLEPLYERHRPLAPGEKLHPNTLTAWNLSELFYAHGTALALLESRRSSRKAREVMATAQLQFEQSGARAYEIVPGHRQMIETRLSSTGIGPPRLACAGRPMSRSLETLVRRTLRALAV